jgi:hypothetical protein
MNIAWVIAIIILVGLVLAYIIKLRREVRKLKEGRQFFGDKCYSCVKHNQANCPRCTLYLTECPDYVSPVQQAIWAHSDPYEK